MEPHEALPEGQPRETQAQPLGSLTGVVRRGAFISAVTLGLIQVISLISTVLLARLLTPEEVGIFTAGTLLSTVLVTFSEGSLRSTLIQREHDVDDVADTVFWATAIGGLLMGLAALAAAPVLGWIFHSDLVTAVAATTSGLLLLESLTNVPDGLMQRRFNFLRKLLIDPSRAISYTTVAVILAASGFGVWSMVLGQYAAVAVWLIGSWSLAKWWPGRGQPSVRLWRELARFAYPMVIQDIVEYTRETVQTALTGRKLGEAALGNYRYGGRLGMLPGLAVVEIGSYVLFPAFSRMADDPERLRAAFLRALRWIWVAAVPVAGLLVSIGEQTVVVVLGERWRDAGIFLVALAGYGLGFALQAVATEVIKAAGRSALFHWTSAIELVLGVGLVIALLPLGLFGVGLAISITEMISGIVLIALAKSIVRCRFSTLSAILTAPAAAAVAATVAVISLIELLDLSLTGRAINALAVLLLLCALFTTIYGAVLCAVDFRLARSLVAKMRSRS